MAEETQVPVYFTHETPQVTQIYEDVKQAVSGDQAASATEGKNSNGEQHLLQRVRIVVGLADREDNHNDNLCVERFLTEGDERQEILFRQ